MLFVQRTHKITSILDDVIRVDPLYLDILTLAGPVQNGQTRSLILPALGLLSAFQSFHTCSKYLLPLALCFGNYIGAHCFNALCPFFP